MTQQKSFTLIELLVVIAIIGLLSSIVLVNIGLPGQRQKARIAKTLEFSSSIQNALGSEAVGIWTFDNNAFDTSGYGNNGTIYGGASFTTDNTPQKVVGSGQGKYALSFDGADDYVKNTLTKGLPTTVMTIEAWIYSFSFANWRVVIAHDKEFDGGWNLNIDSSGQLSFTINSGGSYYSGYKSGTAVNKWHHVIGVYDGSKVKVYIDGAAGTDVTKAGIFLDSSGDLFIGVDNTFNNYFNGLIDEVRIYSQALTIGQIQKNYAEGLEKHQEIIEIGSLPNLRTPVVRK